ncbi:alpha/beta hydrolase [Haliea atlantica]
MLPPSVESLAALAQGLPDFPGGASVAEPVVDPTLAVYLDYYHLDFAGRLPGVGHRIGTLQSGPYRLAVQAWEQPGARHNLLLLHGYFDHTGLYGHLVAHGLARGANVLIFDLPGHGLSSGAPASIDNFASYGAAVSDVLAGAGFPSLPWSVIAQSTGGAALVEFARRSDEAWPFRNTVLLAPLLRPAQWWRVCLAHTLVHRFLDSVPRRFAENSSDREFLDFVRRDPLQSQRIPVAWVGALRRWLAGLPREDLGVGSALLVQGDADQTVDWRYNLPQYGQLFPGLRIELLPGAGHHLANEAVALRERYLRVVDRYCGWR